MKQVVGAGMTNRISVLVENLRTTSGSRIGNSTGFGRWSVKCGSKLHCLWFVLLSGTEQMIVRLLRPSDKSLFRILKESCRENAWAEAPGSLSWMKYDALRTIKNTSVYSIYFSFQAKKKFVQRNCATRKKGTRNFLSVISFGTSVKTICKDNSNKKHSIHQVLQFVYHLKYH